MYVPTVGPPGAAIMLVGEAPGEQEAATGKPFVGNAGRVLSELLNLAGLSKPECLIANIARERPPGNKIAFFYEDKKKTMPKSILKEWIGELTEEIKFYRPNIIVALGDTASYHLTGEKGITAARGYIYDCALVPGVKVLATYHPQKTDYEYKLRWPTVMDLRKAKANSSTPDFPVDKRVLNSSPSRREFMDFLHYLLYDHEDPITLDIETTQPGTHIDILGIAESPIHGMSFRFLSNRKPTMSFDKELEMWKLLAKVLSEKQVIMHNACYDMAVLWHHYNIYCAHMFADTMVAAHVAWPEVPRSLGFMASICLNVPPWKGTSESMPMLYNCADAVNTYGVWKVIEKELYRLDQYHIFEHEMSQIEPAVMLQLNGLKIDLKTRKDLLAQIDTELKELGDKLEQEFGKTINIRSSKQLQELLYEDLGLPIQYKRRKSVNDPRKRTADEEALAKLARTTNNPVLLEVIKWKKLDKLKNSFVLLKDKKTGLSKISPEGKVHTSYNVTGATMQKIKKGLVIDEEESFRSFGRWSSSKSIILPYGSGNLQNIPKIARTMYKAPKGYEFIQADYIQAEAVVVAYIINDNKLIALFEQAYGKDREYRKENFLDVHLHTASDMFQIPLVVVTKPQRKIGKTLRHANNYSAGPAVTAHRLGCSLPEAKKLNQIYHNICPQLSIWHTTIRNKLAKDMTLTNLIGRSHRFLDRWGDTLFRSAYSYIPQSTVGDLLNKSLVTFYKNYGKERIIALQLHDAIYILSPLGQHNREESIGMLRECMTYPLEYQGVEFIIDVDFAAGPSWGELEEI
jgi:uracil-DNA glycosylase family 4